MVGIRFSVPLDEVVRERVSSEGSDSGKSLVKGMLRKGSFRKSTISSAPLRSTFPPTSCVCSFAFALFLTLSEFFVSMISRCSAADLFVAATAYF